MKLIDLRKNPLGTNRNRLIDNDFSEEVILTKAKTMQNTGSINFVV
jgi:hypothetical protein